MTTNVLEAPLYRDIDCTHCGHQGRHVIGRNTGTIYCLECKGTCKDHDQRSR